MPKVVSTHRSKPSSKPVKPAKKPIANDTSIDDIFSAAKGKGKSAEAAAEPERQPTPPKESESKSSSSIDPSVRRKKKKSKSTGEATPSTEKKSPPAPAPAQVVVDTSSAFEQRSKRSKGSSSDATRDKKDFEDHLKFIDSRGTDPRRKTEEGFFIYKEDELGITDKGGDTPLCPFDCDCCF